MSYRILALVFLGSWLPAMGWAEQKCSRSVHDSNSVSAYRYHEPTGHCEGFFVQPISSISGTSIVAFQYGKPIGKEALSETADVVSLQPITNLDSTFEIKGVSLNPSVYFQVDKVSANSRRFDWSVERLLTEKLDQLLPLGFISCVGSCSARELQLVPIRNDLVSGDGLELILQARNTLAVVHYVLKHEAQAESINHSLNLGRHPPRRPIYITLPKAVEERAGRYDLTVFSVTTNGQSDELHAKLVIP